MSHTKLAVGEMQSWECDNGHLFYLRPKAKSTACPFCEMYEITRSELGDEVVSLNKQLIAMGETLRGEQVAVARESRAKHSAAYSELSERIERIEADLGRVTSFEEKACDSLAEAVAYVNEKTMLEIIRQVKDGPDIKFIARRI